MVKSHRVVTRGSGGIIWSSSIGMRHLIVHGNGNYLTSCLSATCHQWLYHFPSRHECFMSDVSLICTRLVSCVLLTSLLTSTYLIVTIICGYYIFANFCDLEKIAKLSTRKNFYHHIRHSGVYTFTNCMMFSTLEHAYNSLLIVSAFLFFFPVPSRAQESDVWWYRWSWELYEQILKFVLTG